MADLIAESTHAAGFGTKPARWVFLFIWICGVWFGLVSDYFSPFDPLNASAYAAGLVGAFILTTPGSSILPPARSAWLPMISLYIVVILLPQIPQFGADQSLIFAMYLVSFAIPRGNLVAGGLGCGLVIGYVTIWAIVHGASGGGLLLLLVIPIGCVAAGVAWRLVLRWIVHQQRHHRSEAGQAAERTAASLEAIRASQRELVEIRAEVAPLLERVVQGIPIDPEMRVALVRIEAAVRDRIRAPHLQHPDLARTFARLRDREITVVVLGESVTDGGVVNETLVARLIEVISDVTEGRITVRSLPPGRQAALSIVLQDQGGSEQILLSATGDTVSRG